MAKRQASLLSCMGFVKKSKPESNPESIPENTRPESTSGAKHANALITNNWKKMHDVLTNHSLLKYHNYAI